MKTLYETNWHCNNDTLVRISVTPIKVLREGILPGCSEVSITAVDSNGHQFQGCPQDFFETEEAAWAQTKIELQETIESEERDVCEAQRRIEGLRSVLSAIQGDEPAEVLQDAISVVGMPEFDALMDYIYEEGTSGEAVVPLANKLVRVAIQSHITHARNAQPAPDVSALVEALEECAASLAWSCFGECRAVHAGPILPATEAFEMALAVLANYRKQQENK